MDRCCNQQRKPEKSQAERMADRADAYGIAVNLLKSSGVSDYDADDVLEVAYFVYLGGIKISGVDDGDD